ncbi:cytochrome b [Sphingomonas sp. ASY06-1R]|uniref:cytochrome b n=1 Tax=Sphingomonas sp. ASY06-1R TaxID=3445771 RepID=UPI003FA26ED8
MADDAARRVRYSKVAIILHWAIAILILFNLATGFFGDAVPQAVFAFHISSGITILALTVIRIVWRLTHRPPPFLPMAAWERALAHIVHFCLYLVMLAAPLTGWAMVSAYVPKPQPGAAAPAATPSKPRPIMIWGVIPLPRIAPITRIADQPDGAAKLKEAHETFEARHETIGWIYIGLLLLHVAGALKHQFIDRRRQFARMGVGKTPAEWDRRT